MKIGIIGTGAISRYVQQHLNARELEAAAILVRPERLGAAADGVAVRVARVADLPDDLSLVIDCAGHAALRDHGPAILRRGMDLVTVSLGALADDAVRNALETAARDGSARLHLASGAIGALDCLRAARVGGLAAVTYTGRKLPAGWKGSPAESRLDLDGLTEAACHFAGSARQAATDYPNNANVAAAVALAGMGFDATQVRLIADPSVTANIHEIHAEGAFGRFSFRIEGTALPDNPRSSALAAMSAVAATERQRERLVI